MAMQNNDAVLLKVDEVAKMVGLQPDSLRGIVRRGGWADAVVRLPDTRAIRFRRTVVERILAGDTPSAA